MSLQKQQNFIINPILKTGFFPHFRYRELMNLYSTQPISDFLNDVKGRVTCFTTYLGAARNRLSAKYR